MSYIGRLPVKVPANVSIEISADNKSVYVKGPLGSKQTLKSQVYPMIILMSPSKRYPFKLKIKNSRSSGV